MKKKIKKEYRTNVGKSIQLMIHLEKLLLEMRNHFGEELAMQFVMEKTIELHSKKKNNRLIKSGLKLKKLKAKTDRIFIKHK